jgi:hypothetical protein
MNPISSKDKIYYHVRESKLQTPVHSQLNPVNSIASNFFNTPTRSSELVVRNSRICTLVS